MDKAKKVAQEIKHSQQNSHITIHQLDLASLKSVRNCAQTLIDTVDKIDILVNNAGKKIYYLYPGNPGNPGNPGICFKILKSLM